MSIQAISNSSNVYNQNISATENHVFHDFMGGKDKYNQLPILDFSKLKTWNGWTNYPDSVSPEDVTAPIMKAINGKTAYQYLIVRFKSRGHTGLSVLFAEHKNQVEFVDCHSHPGGPADLELNMILIQKGSNFSKNDLYKKLLTEGKVEGNDICIELF